MERNAEIGRKVINLSLRLPYYLTADKRLRYSSSKFAMQISFIRNILYEIRL